MQSFIEFNIIVTEAAKGHTIEAHGIRGMKGTPWRKTFKSHEHLSDWADKNDSVEVHATRELDHVKKKTNEEAELAEDKYSDRSKRDFKSSEMEHELGHEVNTPSNSPHAVHINGKKWKSFASQSHAANVAKKIKGATVHKEDYVAEGYTGRETKDGVWRVFKSGQAVAVAGPFKSREEASAWISKQKQGVAEALDSRPVAYGNALAKSHVAIHKQTGKVDFIGNEKDRNTFIKMGAGTHKPGTMSPGQRKVGDSFHKEEVELHEGTHLVNVTVSQPDHAMVSKRKEQIQKKVYVLAGDKGDAQAKAESFYKKKGFKVHGSEYHSVAPATAMKTK